MIFYFIYLFQTWIVIKIYRQAFKTEVLNGQQFITLLMLIMSRRVHSIFMLRCFNDGIAMTFAYLSVYYLQNTEVFLSLLFYS